MVQFHGPLLLDLGVALSREDGKRLREERKDTRHSALFLLFFVILGIAALIVLLVWISPR